MAKDKCCGSSGIGPMHLKFIGQKCKEFDTQLTKLFNYLMSNPESMPRVRLLYKFRPVFIPKD